MKKKLLIVCLNLLMIPFFVNAQIDGTLGNTDVFGRVYTIDKRQAVPYTVSVAGDILSISIYHDVGDGSGMQLGVYSDELGAPADLLGVTPVSAVDATEGWQTIDLLGSVTVGVGETIWLAWVFENNPGIRLVGGTPGRANSPQDWSGGMPSSFGSSTRSDYIYSIYCSYSHSAPAQPTGLSITDATYYDVTLSWIDNSNNETGFEIQRSTTPGSDFTTIHTTSSNTTNYTDEAVLPEITYYYRIRSVNSYGDSNYTPEESVTTLALPTIGNTEVFGRVYTGNKRQAVPYTMSEARDIWSISIYHDVGDGSGMLLGVYSDESGAPGGLLGVTPVSAVDATEGWQTVDLISPVTIGAGETIWLSWVFENNPGIRCVGGTPGRANSPQDWSGGMPGSFGSSTRSDYVYSIYCSHSLSMSGSIPVEPSGLSITDATYYDVTLSWVDNSNNETGFEIQRSTTPGSDFTTVHTTSSNTTTYTDEDVLPEITYYYRIRAVNSYGDSNYTPEESVTTPAIPTASETIGNTELFDRVYTGSKRQAVPYTMSEAGDILSISIFHDVGDGSSMLLGVYSDELGAPAGLLGVTPVSAVDAAEGWQTVNLPSPVTVGAGETIWLSWVFENNPGIRCVGGTPGRANSTQDWNGGMPGSFGSSTRSDYVYSIYCSYSLSMSGSLPAEPSGLSSPSATYYDVTLSWVDNSNNETGFEIQRSTTPGSDFTTIHTTSSNTTTYTDEDVLPEITYYYRIRAVNSYGGSNYTPEESVTTPAIPTASETIGNTELFGRVYTVNKRQAVPYTMSEAGDILSISIYHHVGDGSGMQLGVYSDELGAPAGLLGVTPVSAVDAAEGWQTVNLPSPLTVEAGQTIWLSWVFENNPGIRCVGGTPGRANSTQDWSGGMPSNFGSSTRSDYVYSIYASYAPSSSLKSKTTILGEELTDGDEEEFLVYPNPATDNITVSWNLDYGDELLLTLINTIGEIVEIVEVESNSKQIQMDLTSYKPGIYFVLFTNPSENQTISRFKVIKSH